MNLRLVMVEEIPLPSQFSVVTHDNTDYYIKNLLESTVNIAEVDQSTCLVIDWTKDTGRSLMAKCSS